MHDRPLWVFGYGSLIWHPGFPVAERLVARLDGWHRSFCMHSIHYRGSAEAPGLVLALDAREGAHCDGVAFRVEAGAEDETLAALRERELIASAYIETRQVVVLRDGRTVAAVTFVIDPAHAQYCGGLTLEQQARVITAAVGERGPNRDYLLNTAEHLGQLGITDDDLVWLAERVRSLGANGQR